MSDTVTTTLASLSVADAPVADSTATPTVTVTGSTFTTVTGRQLLTTECADELCAVSSRISDDFRRRGFSASEIALFEEGLEPASTQGLTTTSIDFLDLYHPGFRALMSARLALEHELRAQWFILTKSNTDGAVIDPQYDVRQDAYARNSSPAATEPVNTASEPYVYESNTNV